MAQTDNSTEGKTSTELLYNGKPVIIGKTLAEIGHLVDAGQTLYAHASKQGDIHLRSIAKGQYAYEFEFCRWHESWQSGKTDNETLEEFLAGISFEPDDDASEESNALAKEMKGYLSQPVWSNVDEYTYQMLLETPETEEKPSCDTKTDSSKLKAGITHKDLQELRLDIVKRAKTARQARDFVKVLASTYWEALYRENAYFCLESQIDVLEDLGDHPF